MAKDLTLSLLLDLYGALLTAHQREVAVSYYHYDLSLAEIADNLGVSRQAVMDALHKGREALLKLEAGLGLAAQRSEAKIRIDAALAALDTDPGAAREHLTQLKRML